MHDRLTWLCVDCGLRQTGAVWCVACKAAEMVELGDPLRDPRHFREMAQRNVARHERRYLTHAPSVRHAPLTFAIGATAVVGFSFGLPLSMVSPALGVGVVAMTFLGGALSGLGIARLAPRWLLGKHDKLALESELEALAAADPVVGVAARHQGPMTGFETWEGELDGTPASSPFASEPVLAARVTGRYGALDVDDAWLAPGTLRVEPATARQGPTRVQVALDPAAGLWLRTEDADASPLLEVRPEVERFFAARGEHLYAQAHPTAKDLLRVAFFRPGERVRVTGRPSLRHVSDGYRGSREVVVLEPPHVLSLSR
jgi:hypothetical protein